MNQASPTHVLTPTAPDVGVVAIAVNDESRVVAADSSLAALLADLRFAERRGVAVAVNGTVVPRSNWPGHVLREADRVLVIRATQGG